MTFGRAVGRRGDYITQGRAVQATDCPRFQIVKRLILIAGNIPNGRIRRNIRQDRRHLRR
jgi:hypothetical protein